MFSDAFAVFLICFGVFLYLRMVFPLKSTGKVEQKKSGRKYSAALCSLRGSNPRHPD